MNYLYLIIMTLMLAMSAIAAPQAHADEVRFPHYTDQQNKALNLCITLTEESDKQHNRSIPQRRRVAYCVGWVDGFTDASRSTY